MSQVNGGLCGIFQGHETSQLDERAELERVDAVLRLFGRETKGQMRGTAVFKIADQADHDILQFGVEGRITGQEDSADEHALFLYS